MFIFFCLLNFSPREFWIFTHKKKFFNSYYVEKKNLSSVWEGFPDVRVLSISRIATPAVVSYKSLFTRDFRIYEHL